METKILESYLPKQLTDAELEDIIISLMRQYQCGGTVDGSVPMGEITNYLKHKYAGRYNGKTAAGIAKRLGCS